MMKPEYKTKLQNAKTSLNNLAKARAALDSIEKRINKGHLLQKTLKIMSQETILK
jgi:hypothetical protein